MFVICKWAQTLALPEDGDISRRRITLFEDVYGVVITALLDDDYFFLRLGKLF